ncbi:hypothetical protein EDL96_09820 [Kocuria soli]|uniref:Uncharacterized protein n=1 Tax=Kocuria soli TaxID=2485125 RepID=A0A3N3ZNP9_9MICC|nr:hypothetical protein EDL96_09820 [Kocuria soli]
MTLAGLSIAVFVGILTVAAPGSTSFVQAGLWVMLMLSLAGLHVVLLRSRTQGLAAAEDVLASRQRSQDAQKDSEKVMSGTLQCDRLSRPVPWKRDQVRHVTLSLRAVDDYRDR